MRHEFYKPDGTVEVTEVPDPPEPTRALAAIQRLTDDIAAIDNANAPTQLSQVVTRLSALGQMVRRNHAITRAMLRFMAEQYQQGTADGE